jgi:TorA maturation chaperone TorD
VTATATVHLPIAPEDRARADLYALLARLYARGPDAALLAQVAAAPALLPGEGDSRLSEAWNGLRAASAAIDAESADEEYTSLFIGIGKSDLDLHASHWVVGARSERPLVRVRADLARLGLARLPDVAIYEDHLATLCEAMRVLIVGDGSRPPSPIDEQKQFFDAHLGPWIDACCNAICKHALANLYRYVAQLTQVLVAIERDAFAIDQ